MAFADPPHKNLKVLPADISRQQLIGTMKFFSQSLGVRCTYCHVGTEGQPLSTFDFPSDAKDHKKAAREMLKLVQQTNEKLTQIIGDPDAHVTCFTCHRGSTKPVTEVPTGAVLVPPPPGGAPPPPPKPPSGT
jgi:cytochrome c peroxidase